MEQIRVVEFGCYLSAPLVGKYLNDAGFSVTCIVRSDDCRGKKEEEEFMGETEPFLRVGKTCVVIDLKTNLKEALAIVRESNIVIENFGKDVSKRLGVDFAACKRENPNII